MPIARSWLELAQPKQRTSDYRETPSGQGGSVYGSLKDDYNLKGVGVSSLTADQMEAAVLWNDARPVNGHARNYDGV